MYSDVLTIRKTASRLKQNGLPLSEYALRLLIKKGTIPVRFIGSKALVYYPAVVNYLTCADGADNGVVL